MRTETMRNACGAILALALLGTLLVWPLALAISSADDRDTDNRSAYISRGR